MNSEEVLRRAIVAARQNVPQDQWDSFADAIVRDRRALETNLTTDAPARRLQAQLQELKANSFAILPEGLVNVEVVKQHLQPLDVYKGPHPHVFPESGPMPIDRAAAEFPICCYRWQDVVRAPGLMDQLNDPVLLDLIESYLGCVPTLYGVNSFWYFPADRPNLYYQQHFHRDTDDYRFVALFIYLNDVDEDCGPHQIVPGTATLEGTLAVAGGAAWNPYNEARKFARRSFVGSMGEDFSALCERYMAPKAVNVTGKAGTMFLANTLALHRGLNPRKKPRWVIWARYGLHPPAELPPPISRIDPATGRPSFSFPETDRSRYINRLLFDFDGASRSG